MDENVKSGSFGALEGDRLEKRDREKRQKKIGKKKKVIVLESIFLEISFFHPLLPLILGGFFFFLHM